MTGGVCECVCVCSCVFVCVCVGGRKSALDEEDKDRPRAGTSSTIFIGVASPWRPRAKRPPGGHMHELQLWFVRLCAQM